MSNLNKWKLKIVNDSDSETLSETMRIFALFLCLFLLIISCGTLTYIYLLWNTYWIRVAKLSEERNFMRQQQQQNSVRVLEFDDQVRNWSKLSNYKSSTESIKESLNLKQSKSEINDCQTLIWYLPAHY